MSEQGFARSWHFNRWFVVFSSSPFSHRVLAVGSRNPHFFGADFMRVTTVRSRLRHIHVCHLKLDPEGSRLDRLDVHIRAWWWFMQIASPCLYLPTTTTSSLYQLAGISPPKIRREAISKLERLRQTHDHRHVINHQPARSRLKLRKSFLHCVAPFDHNS